MLSARCLDNKGTGITVKATRPAWTYVGATTLSVFSVFNSAEWLMNDGSDEKGRSVFDVLAIPCLSGRNEHIPTNQRSLWHFCRDWLGWDCMGGGGSAFVCHFFFGVCMLQTAATAIAIGGHWLEIQMHNTECCWAGRNGHRRARRLLGKSQRRTGVGRARVPAPATFPR